MTGDHRDAPPRDPDSDSDPPGTTELTVDKDNKKARHLSMD